MITAVYARKSTEQTGVTDDEKSVARQVALARDYAERNGWTVRDEYIFTDEAVSGAEFDKRPGLQKLLATLKPRAPFDVLIVYDADRLGREQYESGFLLKKLNQAGLRIHECKGKGREIALDSPTDKLLASVVNFAAEQERHQSRERTRAALQYKVERGFAAGGSPFGYENIRNAEGQAERKIKADEANVVTDFPTRLRGPRLQEDRGDLERGRRTRSETSTDGPSPLVGHVVGPGRAPQSDLHGRGHVGEEEEAGLLGSASRDGPTRERVGHPAG